MKKLKLPKFHWAKLLSIFFFTLLLGAYANIFAIGIYAPGETLDPTCTPGSLDCTVNLTTTETDPITGAINGLVKGDGAGNVSAVLSGTDIKTINGSSVLGSGDIVVSSGVTPTDYIFDWDTINSRYQPFSVKLISDPGYAYFYSGNETPSSQYTFKRLNLDGNLWASLLSTQVVSGTTTYSSSFGPSQQTFSISDTSTPGVNTSASLTMSSSRFVISTVKNYQPSPTILIGAAASGPSINGEHILVDDANRLFDINMTNIKLSKGTASKWLALDSNKNISYMNAPVSSYPGSGIANSTGSSWGTSYTTSGSGTVLALTNSPVFITPTLGVASATSINSLNLSATPLDFNTKVGKDSGLNIISGAIANTFLGHEAGRFGAGTTNAADYNTGIGTQSLFSNTTGHDNTGVGAYTFYYNTTGYNNTANGSSALGLNTTGHDNVAVGAYNLYYNNTGFDNTGVGSLALQNNTSGIENTAIGSNSLFTNTTSSFNTAVGAYTLPLSTGANNTAIGNEVLNRNSTGFRNTGLGSLTLYNNTTGSINTAFGYNSLFSNKTGSNGVAIGAESQYYANDTTTSWTNYNTSIGYQSLMGSTTAANNTGNNNTAVGYQALLSNTTGNYNSAQGYYSLRLNTTGYQNTAQGAFSLSSNTTGNFNSAQGTSSLYLNTTGSNNTAQGNGTLNSNTTGSNNTALGASSLYYNTTGNYNSSQGTSSLSSNTTGNRNTAQGSDSLYGNITGNYNSALGHHAGSFIADGLTSNTTSDNSIYLGSNTKALVDDGQNEIVIGYNAVGNGSNTATIGNTSLLRTYLTGVNLKAGTAVAGTAPLKFTSGINLGTTEAGAIEYDGSHLYFTATNGGTRYQLDQQGGGLLSDADFNTKGGTDAGLNLVAGAQRNTFLGYQAGKGVAVTNAADGNTGIGYQSLYFNTTGYSNTANGAASLMSNTTGFQNTASGDTSLTSNITGSYNVAMGVASLSSNTTGESNTATGNGSLLLNNTGSNNTANGGSSLVFNTTGSNNTAIGFLSLYSNNTGSNGVALGYGSQTYANNTTTPWTNYNTSVGYQSLRGSTTAANNTGNYNTAIGYQSLFNNSTGVQNTATGYNSMYSNTSGSNNTSVGRWALGYNISGGYNVAIGFQSIVNNTTGSNNIGLGYQSGMYIGSGTGQNQTSTNSLYLGYDTRASADGNTNEIVVGYGTIGRGSNTAQWGNTSMTNHYFSGSIQFSTYGAGTLTTDASGNVTASSDERLKDIQGDFNNDNDALSIISSINPILYKWNDESGFDQTTLYAGFSAQNIRDYIPEAVGLDKNGYLTLSDRPILATAINAIKQMNLELQNINDLEIENSFRDVFISWLTNASNKITRIFTGEICLTEAGEEAVCINRSELQSLKSLLNTTSQGSGSAGDNNPPTETCSDGIMNQDETNIDEGGVCQSTDDTNTPPEEAPDAPIESEEDEAAPTTPELEAPTTPEAPVAPETPEEPENTEATPAEDTQA